MVISTIKIKYQNEFVGALSYDLNDSAARFEYSSAFVESGIELSPLKMPLEKNRIYTFPALNFDTFKGLPGMLADSLPDAFGNAVLNAWLAQQPDRSHPLTPLERLQYTGTRGMGALEYFPVDNKRVISKDIDIHLDILTELAQKALDHRNGFAENVHFGARSDNEMMHSLLAVSTSAGGARPKAVLAFNEDFSQVRSGQGDVPSGFSHYLLKFDGVKERDPAEQTFGDPLGYGAMEYVYYLMATKAGINMMPCKLLEEGLRRHFVTKRFDRLGEKKCHIQTLSAMDHVNYHGIGQYSYEQLFQVARKLRIPKEDALELFRRMVFNHVATNHDDHSKNFAFMLADNRWRLTPAYDVAFSYKPGNTWVEQHWMTLNSKRSGHNRNDFHALAKLHLPKIPTKQIDAIIDEVIEAVSMWTMLAKNNDVPASLITNIETNIHLQLYR